MVQAGDAKHPGAAQLATTQWNLVRAAAGGAGGRESEALEELCRLYWMPLYAWIRRQGPSAEDAQDLLQGFFEHLLEHGALGKADPARGRFRSFLLKALKHYLNSEHRHANAQKRGRNVDWIVWRDEQSGIYSNELHPATLTPEECYEKHWATVLLQRVLAQLRSEFLRRGKPELFDRLEEHLGGEADAVPYSALAEEFAVQPGALRATVYRLRRRYRELLRAEITRTVSDPSEMEEELLHLIDVFAR